MGMMLLLGIPVAVGLLVGVAVLFGGLGSKRVPGLEAARSRLLAEYPEFRPGIYAMDAYGRAVLFEDERTGRIAIVHSWRDELATLVLPYEQPIRIVRPDARNLEIHLPDGTPPVLNLRLAPKDAVYFSERLGAVDETGEPAKS